MLGDIAPWIDSKVIVMKTIRRMVWNAISREKFPNLKKLMINFSYLIIYNLSYGN